MSEPCVVKAEFVDYKTVRTRSALQLILEIPIEQQAEIFAKLGYPLPGEHKWVAVALLDQLVASETEHQQKAKLRVVVDPEMERARKQSVMIAKSLDFIRWANGQHIAVCDERSAAQFIRDWCGVDTRGKIATDREAYRKFKRLIQIFSNAVPGRVAEVRG